MAQNYFGIVTRTGHGLIAAALAGGTAVRLTHVALGDGGGAPVAPAEDMAALVNEVHRAPINTLTQDAEDPALMWAEVVLPANVGGWYVREAGILDEEGNLIAVAGTPESYKPELAEGSGSEFVLKLPLVLTNTDTVTIKIDPTVVLASRQHVADGIASHDASAEAHADMRSAIEAAAHGGDEHAARTDNPHATTKAHVGLGNLPNAKSDSVTSTSSDSLATSKAAKTAYDRGSEALTSSQAHAAHTDNPHATTKAHVGLGNLPNAKSDSVTSTSSNSLATSKAAKTAYDRGSAALASSQAHAARTDNPHGLTAGGIGASAVGHTHVVADIDGLGGYQSALLTLVAAGTLTLTHGLGGAPVRFQCSLVCQSAEFGWVAGQEVFVGFHEITTAANGMGCAVRADATKIYIKFGNNTSVFSIIRADSGNGGAVTASKWKFRIRAWR